MKKNNSNNDKDNEQRGSLKLVTSFGGTSVKNIDNRLATMMIREDDEVVRERRLKGSLPIDTTKQGTIPKAIHKPLKQILFHPRRPKWSPKLSQAPQDEAEMAPRWLLQVSLSKIPWMAPRCL